MAVVKNNRFTSEQKKATQTTNRLHRLEPKAQFSAAFANGTVVAEYPVGMYAYRMSQLGIVSDAAIAGKTVQREDGIHYVETANWGDYVDVVTVRLNGRIVREYDVAHLIKLQDYWNFEGAGQTTNGLVKLPFGGPGFLDDESVEDLLMLGTGNVRSFEVHFKLTGAFDGGTMRFSSMEEYVSLRRPASVIQGLKTMRATVSASGEFSFNDIPIHDPITAIYFKGSGINALKFKVGEEVLIDAPASHLNAYAGAFRFHNPALEEGIYINFLRDGDAKKALAPLTTDADRKENAAFTATLDMASAGEVQVIIEYLHKFDPN